MTHVADWCSPCALTRCKCYRFHPSLGTGDILAGSSSVILTVSTPNLKSLTSEVRVGGGKAHYCIHTVNCIHTVVLDSACRGLARPSSIICVRQSVKLWAAIAVQLSSSGPRDSCTSPSLSRLSFVHWTAQQLPIGFSKGPPAQPQIADSLPLCIPDSREARQGRREGSPCCCLKHERVQGVRSFLLRGPPRASDWTATLSQAART